MYVGHVDSDLPFYEHFTQKKHDCSSNFKLRVSVTMFLVFNFIQQRQSKDTTEILNSKMSLRHSMRKNRDKSTRKDTFSTQLFLPNKIFVKSNSRKIQNKMQCFC